MATFKKFRFKPGKITSDSIVHNNETLDNNLNLQSGQTITISAITLSGFVTGSTKELFFSVLLPRDIEDNSNIEITSFMATLRTGKGYLNSESGAHEYVGRSGYTVSCYPSSKSVITDLETSFSRSKYVTIHIVKSTAFTNIDNNTLVSAWANVTLKIN